MPRKLTIAAGVVTFDDSGQQRKVLLVHRPGYDDWSLPKGKLEPGETLVACAVRETEEETGVTVRLGLPAAAIRYDIGGGEKEVHYWTATPVRQRHRPPNKEVDQAVWLTIPAALARMSYADERAIVDEALALPETTPLLIVRHAKALDRADWTDPDDAQRPLKDRGHAESAGLVPLLQAYGITRLVSSSSMRCLQTLIPYAEAAGLTIESAPPLSEEQGIGHEKAVAKLVRRLAAQTAADGIPTAICGHRPLLPTMLTALSVVPRTMQPAVLATAHLDQTATTVAVEWHRPS